MFSSLPCLLIIWVSGTWRLPWLCITFAKFFSCVFLWNCTTASFPRHQLWACTSIFMLAHIYCVCVKRHKYKNHLTIQILKTQLLFFFFFQKRAVKRLITLRAVFFYFWVSTHSNHAWSPSSCCSYYTFLSCLFRYCSFLLSRDHTETHHPPQSLTTLSLFQMIFLCEVFRFFSICEMRECSWCSRFLLSEGRVQWSVQRSEVITSFLFNCSEMKSTYLFKWSFI